MSQVREYYRTLYEAWGMQHWWPGRSRFEVIAGAVLVQNTAWRNVELALQALRSAGALSVAGMRAIPAEELEAPIRPAGYFRQKARTLKHFIAFLDDSYRGSLSKMFSVSTERCEANFFRFEESGRRRRIRFCSMRAAFRVRG